MAQILSFLKEASYDPEMTKVMGEAFEAACRQLADRPDPLLRVALAKSILSQAQRGERDPDTMWRAALAATGIRPLASGVAGKTHTA